MMLGEQTDSADYWKACGDAALANGVKGIVIMGAHWDCRGSGIEVATNPSPAKSPVAMVHPSKYASYPLKPDLPTAARVIDMLNAAGFSAKPNPSFTWIHDTYLILIRMFPAGNMPPATLLSLNARMDPHFHMQVGLTLRGLREEGYLLIGTGGAVHNLYRNDWSTMVRYRDNLSQTVPPEHWALEFRQAFEDALTKNSGPDLRRAVTRLMKHPEFREAHATDDHFMAACFVAGAAGGVEDWEVTTGELGAETWELSNMCNSQYTVGRWQRAHPKAMVGVV
ncbi:MAG: hypothetical protein M1819_000457 [Sarea resinae]|nr:MAG: hypothetical protein M1819_000457 [Sarea resinae]